MTFYFTSTEPNIKIADSENAKLTENKMISAFCLANPLEEPYNWFPCDFGSDGTVQYHELFENAFKEATKNKKGFLYAAEAEDEDIEETGEILTVCKAKKELSVTSCEEIENLYDWLMENEDMGRFRLYTFEQHSRQELLLWDNSILRYLSSGNVKGVGPKTAQRIVETFGNETFSAAKDTCDGKKPADRQE